MTPTMCDGDAEKGGDSPAAWLGRAISPRWIGDPGRAGTEPPASVADGGAAPVPGPADAELAAAAVPGALLLAASVRGLDHRALAGPRQDAFALAAAGQTAIAVVCDGVGSLSRSHEAAALVSRHLAEFAADALRGQQPAGSGPAGAPWPEALWPEAFCAVNQSLREQACGGDMATTAMALAIRRERGAWAGEAAWVGDSPLWHLDDEGQWRQLAGPAEEDAEVHSTQVNALPSPDGKCQVASFRVVGGAVFLMSDGVANPLRWSAQVKEALADWWGGAMPPDLFAFAAEVAFARKTHTDDRTVVGIWLTAGEDQSGSPDAGRPGRTAGDQA
jgi:Protein phosphatase 2C